ncbi:SpoIIE family protein phosphatase, partial [Modestobacter sp. NPDC049651]|uniref:SpoIIE family protein phosphatase n=1 Tax=Modestobacter sp. NPDC049651 TaxID=3155777 RepID=UPI0033C014DF
MSGPPTGTDVRAEAPADAERLALVRRLEATALGASGLRRLTELATRLLDVDAAQVSLLGEHQTAVVVSGRSANAAGDHLPLPDSLCALALDGAPEPLVVADAAHDPRVAGRSPVADGEIGAYLGVPLGEVQGHRVGVLCAYGPEPRAWTERDVALLRLMADSAAVELELAALVRVHEDTRLRLELAVDAAGIGTFDSDLVTGRLNWDDRTQQLYGYEPGGFSGEPAAMAERLHPEDRGRVMASLRAAVEDGSTFEHEYRVVLPDGSVRWLQARGRIVADADGRPLRIIGAVHDTTRQRHTDAQVARVLETMPAAFYSLTADLRFSYVNAHAERLLDRPREELLGRPLAEVFPIAQTRTFLDHYRTAVETGLPVSFEAAQPGPDGRWFEVRALPGPEGLAVYLVDVTARRRAQRAADLQAQRLGLLGQVSEALSSALIERRGARAALDELSSAMVPALADWVMASLVGEDSRLHEVVSWHRDPALRPATARYAELRLAALPQAAPLFRALGQRELVHIPDLPGEVGGLLPAGEVRELFDALGPVSGVAVPLMARGRALGSLTLGRGRDREPWDDDDLRTVQEVADRVALALDSAALHEHERRMAADLQRSLLTDPPQPDHCQIAVRYVPAVRAAQVGGDWYDAFLQRDGATVLVIGDVVGHDTVAAAAMGQLRSLLRAIAYSSGAGPAAVLTDLDRAMAGLQVHTLATAAVARLERDAGDPDQVRLRWSSAGHPPLLVRHDDGRVEELGQEISDLILGVDPDTARNEHVTPLRRGATVLMYTDGLVESRELPVDER